jgi:hypothetical protein
MSKENSIIDESVKIEIIENKGKSVFANKTFEVGDIVISSKREYVEQERTIHSIQWDEETHILIDEPGRLVNHSCDANVIIRTNSNDSYDFVAFKKIEIGTELTLDYETTEFISISVPKCLCGSERCRKTIIGFKFRSELLKSLYNNNVADYLKD